MHRSLDALAQGPFDVLILGGGITGAGVALDASLRGFRVALIDKSDFASGTSNVSSKLIHGGLRYLEYGQFPLVYEALHERRLLLHNAPHLVHPLRFVVPFFRTDRVRPWQWRAALSLYDLLAGLGNLRRSRPLDLPRLCREFPKLTRTGLQAGAEYYDAQVDDARLCIEVLKTAAAHGACVANYVEAVAFESSGERITGVHAVDRAGGQELLIRALVVVNATGPWVDSICRLVGDTSGPHLQPTKGVHLVAEDLGFRAALLLLHPSDGRVFFVLPWQGKTLVGTTDTPCDESADALTVTAQDRAYLLAGYNHFFSPPLGDSAVLNTFVGLRPLIRSKREAPSARPREFRIFTSRSGLMSVAGGKLTTYRGMAEAITDKIAARLGRRGRSRTKNFQVDGAPREPWDIFYERETASLEGKYRLTAAVAAHLVGRYGRRATDVVAYLERDPALAKPVVLGEPELRAEFVYQQEHEMALLPVDHLLRRTHLGLFRPELLRRVGRS
jgi:glycerol-3-phosphate dehydrogenase